MHKHSNSIKALVEISKAFVFVNPKETSNASNNDQIKVSLMDVKVVRKLGLHQSFI